MYYSPSAYVLNLGRVVFIFLRKIIILIFPSHTKINLEYHSPQGLCIRSRERMSGKKGNLRVGQQQLLILCRIFPFFPVLSLISGPCPSTSWVPINVCLYSPWVQLPLASPPASEIDSFYFQ